MRTNLRNAPREPFFYKHTHMISPINIGYVWYFDPKSHQRSLEVTRGHRLWYVDPKIYRRSTEVTGGQNEVKIEISTQGPNFWLVYLCNIPDLHGLWYFDPKIDKRTTEVTGGQNEVKFVKCTNGPNVWHLYSHYIPDQYWIWYFDLKSQVTRGH